jgi:acetate---CoA ligase (ADP-forming)
MTPVGYPAERAVDVVLRDGSTIHVRPVLPGDTKAIQAFLERLSPDSRAFRFFTLGVDLHAAAELAAQVDYVDAYGVIALAGPEERVVGHACWVREGPDTAEIAFATADELQGHGLATTLLAHLAEAAVEQGVTTFTASVLPANHKMIKVFTDSGFPTTLRSEPGELLVQFPAELSDDALDAFAQRDRVASAAAVSAVLKPESVALIGASRREGTIGAALAANLRAGGFRGPVHMVNSAKGAADGVNVHSSLLDVDGPVDLAVIAVPAPAVPSVARDCALKGVRALVVVSSGFGEAGEDGIRRQRELMAVCRAAGIRVVGPNCLGVLNASTHIGLNATFSPTMPPSGHVGVMTQSGGVAIALIERARELGLGVSSLASVGDKADLSSNDFVQFWEQDEDTRAIALYLESFGNPRKFTRVARRVGARKPILAVKAGRTKAGGRAAGSHTGALLAASDVTVDALFRQAGVVRADTLGELLDVAALVAEQPLPAGPSVAVLTNAGGPGIMCADMLEGSGLSVNPLRTETRDRLALFLPADAALANPVDMIASASAEDYGRALRILMDDEGVNAVIALFVPPLVTMAEDVGRELAAAVDASDRGVPVLAAFMQSGGAPASLDDARRRIPSYSWPEDAARALARATEYATWRGAPRGEVPSFPDVRSEEAAAVVSEALTRGETWLAPDELATLCDCYGIGLAEWRVVENPRQAGLVAHEFGADVALKAVSPMLVHKSDAGGVRVGLRGEASVLRAATRMRSDIRDAGYGECTFLVQRMVEGIELLVGVVNDPQFGPVLACAPGGTAAELTQDVAVRLTPLTDRDASETVRSLRSFPLLEGYRGAPPADVAALEQVLLRVSALVEAHPQIAEFELNPVVVSQHGAVAVDARARVAPAAPGPPTPSVGR